MSMEKVKLADADLSQLRQFALTLGLELKPQLNTDGVRRAIRESGWTGEEFGVPTELKAPEVPNRTGRQTRIRPGTESLETPVIEVLVQVHEGQDAAGGEPAWVSVNGRAIFIPRGEKSWVREEYVEALEHAETLIYNGAPGGVSGLELEPRRALSYPFSYA